ncbi:twin-arginine translocation signal domain-containing protein [Duganella sp. FT135W]|uniref:Twin-arginine translocation signal domain-containing protein n=1 Tax=Duganella flavida TaxID=2692175 RepID=A0A6L8KD75_9BURK|nr:twin-arginine translocation signal domain-containing protein [Duganella flavida]MYM23782.1 twin-arginine translocation signal domain-containing protein [Duganella flavida]
MQLSRRSFLKIGAAGAMTLAAGGALYRLAYPPAPQPFGLEGGAQAVLDAIIPVMLGPMLPDDAPTRAATVQAASLRVRDAVRGLPLATQKEVQDLFGLLALGPARRLLAGVAGGWEHADPRQVEAFLQSWRTHSLQTLQIAYHALHDLIIGAWYADPSTWERIGYPGPLKELLA